MPHLFISYSHKDGEYAHQLKKTLEQFGWPVWMDDRIELGTSWMHAIQDNLDSCAAFIVIVTPNAFQSTWVQNELSRAQRLNKRIIALLLEGDPWVSIEATQFADVKNGKDLPQQFFDDLKKVMAPSPDARESETKVEHTEPDAQPARPATRAYILGAIFVVLLAILISNAVRILSKGATTGDIMASAVGVFGMVVSGSGVSREEKKRTWRGRPSWEPASVAIKPFRLTPSFESGIYGGLMGGAVAGLIIGFAYFAQNPEAGLQIVPEVFVYALVVGSVLGAASQLCILAFRYLATERRWSSLIFNEITGGLIGSALMGIPLGALCGANFFPRGTAFIDPVLLVVGAATGAIFVVLGALLYNYKGRLRYVARALLTSLIMLAAVYVLLNPVFQAALLSLFQGSLFQPCISGNGDLINPTGFCYVGLGAFMGLGVGSILGLQIGLTLFFYRIFLRSAELA